MARDKGHLTDLHLHTDVIVLTVKAVAGDLVALDVQPPLRATARFGLVSLSGRHEAPALQPVRELLAVWARELAAGGVTAG